MVSGFLFGLTVVGVMAAMFAKRWSRDSKRREREQLPGLTPERAISIQRFDEIQDWVRRTPCADGSRPVIVAEGSLQHGARSMRVVHVECSSSRDAFALYFDVSTLLN
ncbi:MAG: hypothetical protein AAFP04_08510 [Myxococcota bacterium]